MKRYKLVGDKYTLYFRDATEQGGRIEMQISNNEMDKDIGCVVLLNEQPWTIDEIAKKLEGYFD